MTEEQEAMIKRQVCYIANGYRPNRNGNKTFITRREGTDIARGICLDMGWEWQEVEDKCVHPYGYNP